MRITQHYLTGIFKSNEFCTILKDAGLFTFDSLKESVFIVVKEQNNTSYKISNFGKGDYFALEEGNFTLDDSTPDGYCALQCLSGNYGLIDIHYHPGNLVPSLYFDDVTGYPGGDLFASTEERRDIRENLDYDVKPISGVAKIHAPPVIDVLLYQEKTDRPLGFGQIAEVEKALQPFRASNKIIPLSEAYHHSQQVASAIADTGYYNTLILRYRNGRPLKADLEKLVDFEFDERLIMK